MMLIILTYIGSLFAYAFLYRVNTRRFSETKTMNINSQQIYLQTSSVCFALPRNCVTTKVTPTCQVTIISLVVALKSRIPAGSRPTDYPLHLKVSKSWDSLFKLASSVIHHRAISLCDRRVFSKLQGFRDQ